MNNKDICMICSKLEKMLYERGYDGFLVWYYDIENSFTIDLDRKRNNEEYVDNLYREFVKCKRELKIY